jgi:two-component system CheB/CheR fusion protein
MVDSSDSGKDRTASVNRADTKPAIVGIGASAGGIRALQDLFEALPERLGATYVVVVHLDPEHQSDLASILGARTKMPVSQIEATANLQPNHVYVVAPNRRLHITDHEISAVEFDEPRGRRVPIDFFFRSLAERHGDGFAVILSGAGSDGAIGVKAVKEAGGIILVQDPNEAEYPSMPHSAIATGVADFVLPVQELAMTLGELVQNKESAWARRIHDFDEDLLRRVLAHLRVRTGHDFSLYKRSTVLRRIARRVQVTRSNNLAEYYDFLRDSGEESQSLLADLLISVTTFFRDSEAFEALATQVIPKLFIDKHADETIRVWVPGCATGEEAYTVAILLLEEGSRREVRPRIQVLASDLDSAVLAIAREGRYPIAIEADVSEDRLNRYFSREGEHYRVRRELRDVVLFAVHSVLKDPPFSRIDLIACRNVLIYLDRELQQQVCSTFHYALKPGGFLFLGASETADNPPGLFRTFNRKARIFQSTAHPGEKPQLIPKLLGGLRLPEAYLPPARRQMPPPARGNEAALHREALESIAPPSMMVDELYRIVHLSNNAGRYLQLPGGPLTGDATELARPELRFALRSALHRAFQQREGTLTMPILVSFNGSPHRVYLQVRPVLHDEASPRQTLVLFIEEEAVDQTISQAVAATGESASEMTVRQLSEELQATQSRMRTMQEEADASNEELRAANEELQSINEEYRSTSEELETSREELQSINEELQTVNNELKLKLEVISRAYSDLQNLMAATDFATLFLDPDLRIRRLTPRITELFSVTPSDEGRPITDFAHHLDYEGFVSDARVVLNQLTPVEREVRTKEQRWYQMRMRPYRTVDNKIDGIAVSFLEFTQRRKAEERFRLAIEAAPSGMIMVDSEGRIILLNAHAEKLFGYGRDELNGQKVDMLVPERFRAKHPGLRAGFIAQPTIRPMGTGRDLFALRKDGSEFPVEIGLSPIVTDQGTMVLAAIVDITERQHSDEMHKTLARELEHRSNNLLAIVQSIAHKSLSGNYSLDEAKSIFDTRLAALARVTSQLTISSHSGVSLGIMLRSELEPFTAQTKIEGPEVNLSAKVAQNFCLALHELVTNAVKHGALSIPRGKVDIFWTVSGGGDNRVLQFRWRERAGPRVVAPSREGFGTSLLKATFPENSLEYLPEGLSCEIKVPLARG